ncbi:methyltransferase [Flavobacterium sp. RHBU_3]|uniref:methyltransferase n=1 Tax=Flavobacterium sp. RHBU_3 TaxID=3391184 RepID=UPI003984F58B
MTKLDKNYWENRYQSDDAKWDAKRVTTPIKDLVDSLTDKKAHILVPGAGNGHEFEYLINNGFTNTYMLDIAESPLKNAIARLPQVEASCFILGDFFAHEGQYDIIIEQTFFCALDPALRSEYVAKMHSLLKPGGILAGLLFNFPLTQEGPPFGGSTDEYNTLFGNLFHIKTLQTAQNSIKPRQDRELFFIFEKK